MTITIRTTYYVHNVIPDRVWEIFNSTEQYEQAIIMATRGNSAAGCHDYTNEWAEFDTLEEAKECDDKMKDLVRFFTAKAEEYDKRADEG